MLKITGIYVNCQKQPEGIERLEQIGWKLYSDQQGGKQAGYEYQIAEDCLFESVVIFSGKVKSGESVHITKGLNELSLKPSKRYYLRVRVWSENQECCIWEITSFVTGILDQAGWRAKFITAENGNQKKESKAYHFLKKIKLNKKVKSAYAHVTALGLYHFYLNGKKVGESEFTPGWTSYKTHLLYQTYEVTEYLHLGFNAVGGIVGAGWYKGDVGSLRSRNHYGDKTAFFCLIVVTYEDGATHTFFTDETWKCIESAITFSEIYDGEIYDARMECKGWNDAGYNDESWDFAKIEDLSLECLSAQGTGMVNVADEIQARQLLVTSKGEQVIDFGQNLAGWPKFRARGKNGQRIELKCFETLDAEGNVYLDNLRTAKQTIVYICSGEDEEWFHPHFSYQGFQYIEIVSYPKEPECKDFIACVLHSEMEETGKFACSNQDLNSLFHNIRWGMKGNFLDIPTDCPQRDERLGWTGDAQIFCRTAAYLMDTYIFFDKWLRDVEADQTPEGGIPHVVPDIWTGKQVQGKIFEKGTHSAAAWADAVIIIPWTLYLMYGDTAIIRKRYSSMKAWIEFMRAHAVENIWNYKLQFGDWVALDAKEGSYYGATPNELTCTAYYAYSTELFTRMARIIGKAEDAEIYSMLYEKIKESFQKTFLDETGRLKVQTQTAQIISLHFQLLPEKFRQNAVADLLRLMELEGGHLVTGFVGTPYFCQVLSDNGHTKEAYELLLKEDYPSWLYQVKQGATTVWEHWDGKRPDGTMWNPAMNSFNHYAYGAVGEWMFRGIAGIDCDEEMPGFKRVVFCPKTGGGLEYVCASYDSIYGRIWSRWHREDGQITLTVEIPCNAEGLICLDKTATIKENGGLCFIHGKEGLRALTGSGTYRIIYTD